MTIRRLALLAINLALAGALSSVYANRSDVPSIEPNSTDLSTEENPETNPSIETEIESMDLSDIGVTLFKPATLAEVAASEPEDPVYSLRLLGVIQSPLNKIAIVLKPSDAKPLRLRLGGEVDGWKVTQIERKSVTLQRGDDKFVLQLDSQTSPAPEVR